MHDLLVQSCPISQLSRLPGQGVSYRHGGDRRRVPVSGERSHGGHGGQMGTRGLRSRSQTPSLGDQWRFRCVLGIPRDSGVSTQSPGHIRRDALSSCPLETRSGRKKRLTKQGYRGDWKTRVDGVVSKKTHPSKNAAYKLVKRMVAEDLLEKDAAGKLLPGHGPDDRGRST